MPISLSHLGETIVAEMVNRRRHEILEAIGFLPFTNSQFLSESG